MRRPESAISPESASHATGAAYATRGRWITDGGSPLMGWLSAQEGRASESAVLILAPVGYQYWSSHRTLRVLAERLAADGHLVLRFDYQSTGDSAGDQWDPHRLSAWRASVASAAAELRHLGSRRLVLVGVRLGATLALIDGASLAADAVVAWAPVASGRRYVRELRLLSSQVPAACLPSGVSGAEVSAGTTFTADTLDALSALDVSRDATESVARVLLVDGSAQTKLVEHLQAIGSDVEQRQVCAAESALESPTEYATVPEEIVEAIRTWIGPGTLGHGELRGGHDCTRLNWRGTTVTERVVELGAERLVGVLTAPTDTARDTVVFLNSGSEPHIGPGRAWVEYARELAVLGHRCLRVDFRGWGESPDEGYAPGRPYDAHCEDDTIEIVRALRELGHEQIVLVGLCASAWVALRAVLREPVAGVIALNPQMYWKRGDPVEATMEETHRRRTAERSREQRGRRCGLWTALDLIGHRPWAGKWLDDLRSADTDVVMVFAERDEGIEYLRNRLSRRLRLVQRSGTVRVLEVPQIDHSMYRVWLRPLMVRTLHEQVKVITAEG